MAHLVPFCYDVGCVIQVGYVIQVGCVIQEVQHAVPPHDVGVRLLDKICVRCRLSGRGVLGCAIPVRSVIWAD